MVASILLVACAAAVGPMSYLRPYDMAKDDLRKLQEQVERDRAAANGMAPQEEGESDDTEVAVSEAPAAPEVPSSVRGKVSLPLGGLRLPIMVGLGAAWAGYRTVASAQVSSQIEAEIDALKELTRSRSGIETPAGRKRAALVELRRRKDLLSAHVLPLLVQLEQPVDTPSIGKPLGAQTADELHELHETLRARVEACGTLLAEYEALGQPPPTGFRAWPLARLQQQLAHFSSKGEELREVAQLLSRLGGPRVDGDLAEMDVATLKEYAATLEEQVIEAEKRKEKAELLGKIEAELWRRKEEAPVALATLSTKKLRRLYKHLKSGGAAAALDI